VRRLLGGLALGAGFATLALVVARLVEPGRGALEVDIYVLLVGGMTVLTAVLATRQAFPVGHGSALAAALESEPDLPVRPPELERTERVLAMSATTAFDVHYRLRPIVREIAEQRLVERRGLKLDAEDPRLEEALGGELWELVRPDREPPALRFAPGLDPEALREVIERLEQL
jgi:hypothetical protein